MDPEWLQYDVVERAPCYQCAGYGGQPACIYRNGCQAHHIEFYDWRAELLKTLEMIEYLRYQGGICRAHHDFVNSRPGGIR